MTPLYSKRADGGVAVGVGSDGLPPPPQPVRPPAESHGERCDSEAREWAGSPERATEERRSFVSPCGATMSERTEACRRERARERGASEARTPSPRRGHEAAGTDLSPDSRVSQAGSGDPQDVARPEAARRRPPARPSRTAPARSRRRTPRLARRAAGSASGPRPRPRRSSRRRPRAARTPCRRSTCRSPSRRAAAAAARAPGGRPAPRRRAASPSLASAGPDGRLPRGRRGRATRRRCPPPGAGRSSPSGRPRPGGRPGAGEASPAPRRRSPPPPTSRLAASSSARTRGPRRQARRRPRRAPSQPCVAPVTSLHASMQRWQPPAQDPDASHTRPAADPMTTGPALKTARRTEETGAARTSPGG